MFRLIAAVVTMQLVGCGFQLQGAVSVPNEMQRTHIDAIDEYSLFHRQLRLELQEAGVEIVESIDEATAIVSIFIDETDQRVLSVSARNVPTEYEVYYTVEYSITAGPDVLLRRQDMTLTRDYTYDTTLVLGKAREEALMREALVDDLVRVVLKQISSL